MNWTIRATASMVLMVGGASAIALRTPNYAMSDVNLRAFASGALASPPEVVDCTLENGATARCVRLVVRYLPEGKTIGPFCPATIDDVGGMWQWDGENAGLYRIDGPFLRMLKTLGYSFYEPDGTVHVADPNRSPPGSGGNACLQASLDKTVTMTMLIPQTPVVARSATRLGTVNQVGVALDGVPIFSDAPSVLHTGHMPALDTCGGHVDPGGWYHWHATATGSYHYHAPQDFPNLPPCLSGVQARNNFVTTAKTGIGSRGGGGPRGGPGPGGGPGRAGRSGPGGPPPGFAEAAKTLGVSEQALMNAVRENGGRRLDFAAAAEALGVSEEALRAALPPPPR